MDVSQYSLRETVKKGCKNMVRQCAWCMRLIDSNGERVSQVALPKLYEASHGMCDVCGMKWLQQMLGAASVQNTPLCIHNDADDTSKYAQIPAGESEKPSRTTTQLVHELREREPLDVSILTL